MGRWCGREENSGRLQEEATRQRPKSLRVVGKDGSTKFEVKLGAPGTGVNETGMSEDEIAKFAAVTAEMGEDEVVGHYSE